ncbi:MAG: tetratricopeptide repeat protein, partial [Caulobacteraceae bacterium]|nr:tetratricopeptide repeat protein [Caulobacter sp.]
RTFSGPARDRDRLLTAAAEYVYGEAEPSLYALYLSEAGRGADALRFLDGVDRSDMSDDAQADLLNVWGVVLLQAGRDDEAAKRFHAAVALDPFAWRAWNNLMLAEPDEEAQWRNAQAAASAMRRAPSGRQPSPPERMAVDLPLLDYRAALDGYASLIRSTGSHSLPTGPMEINMASAAGALHDWEEVRRLMARLAPAAPLTRLLHDHLAGDRLSEAGRFADAAARYRDAYAVWLAMPDRNARDPELPCALAYVLGRAGERDESARLFAAAAPSTSCLVDQARLADAAGDRARADALLDQAERLAPDTPFPVYGRGLVSLARGDLDAAAAAFRTAHERAPHWAEPLKGLGDAAAAAHRYDDARRHYDAALREAPEWPELRAARNAAAAAAGKRS